jgi:mRNA-degrading endonuclease RelE of RelBE toxin-antitoxin system
MNLKETSKFKKSRKKLKAISEKDNLKEAIESIVKKPEIGKKLKGEFKDLRVYRYFVDGQSRRLIYKLDGDDLILFSFGPREGIYRK